MQAGSLKQAMTKASAGSSAMRRASGITTESASCWVAMPAGPSGRSVTAMTGPPARRSGVSAASMAAVTAREAFGLMTRMRAGPVVPR